jgi:hypothetical protein
MSPQSHFMRYAYLCLVCIFLHSCYTVTLLDNADLDRKSEKIKKVHSAYFDSSHQLIINFEARLDGSWKKRPYNIRVNVDSGLQSFDQPLKKHYYYTIKLKGDTSKTNLKSAYPSLFNATKKEFLCLEYKRQCLNQGFLLADTAVSFLSTVVYADKAFSNTYKLNNNDTLIREKRLEANAKFSRIVFESDSLLKSGIKNHKDYGIAVHIEPSQKRRYIRYLLLPGTVVADIVTFPVQVIIALKLLSKMPIS